MNHEIRKSIGCNSKSDEEQIVNSFNAIVEKHDTRHGKITKDIITFKNISVLRLMMIFMKKNTTSRITVKPSHTFHKQKTPRKIEKEIIVVCIY
jgi:hypothetical protein